MHRTQVNNNALDKVTCVLSHNFKSDELNPYLRLMFNAVSYFFCNRFSRNSD